MARSRRHKEGFIIAEVYPAQGQDRAWGTTRSAWSYREFGKFMDEALKGK